MATAFPSPGVYPREIDRSLYVSSLSDTPLGLVGTATWGPINEPTTITNTDQLFTTFGPPTGALSYNPALAANYPLHPMLYSGERYLRRGRRAVVVRVAESSAKKSTGYLSAADTNVSPPATNTTTLTNPTAGTAATSTPSPASALTAGTYFVGYSLVTATGETTAVPIASALTVTAGDAITLTIPAISQSGVLRANVYVGTPNGANTTMTYYCTTAVSSSTSTAVLISGKALNLAGNTFLATARYYGTYGNRLKLQVATGSNSTNLTPTKKVMVHVNTSANTAVSKLAQAEAFDGVTAVPSDANNYILNRIKTDTSALLDLSNIGVATSGGTAPSAPTPITAGALGYLPAGTYQVAIAYVSTAGVESLPSSSTTVTVTATGGTGSLAFYVTPPNTESAVYVYLAKDTETLYRVKTLTAGTSITFNGTNKFEILIDREPGGLLLKNTPLTADFVTLSSGNDGLPSGGSVSVYKGTGASPGSPATGLQIFRNPEAVQIGLLACPGIYHTTIVNELIDICEVSRMDALALVDPPYNLFPDEVVKWHNGVSGVLNSPQTAINSSYAALYWPWGEVDDAFNDQKLFIPPSSFAAEVMAYNDFISEPWYAPAGLNRGRILNIRRLQYIPALGERDLLYSGGNTVNPIATFPSKGAVIWGQRTCQKLSTALDRVNVRRLLIYLRKIISDAALGLVFEPNDPTMWRQFVNITTPVLQGVKDNRGLVDFRVVMDETTNPPTVVDQNQAIGRIYLKPTKSAEIIVLDFIVMNQSATFSESTALA